MEWRRETYIKLIFYMKLILVPDNLSIWLNTLPGNTETPNLKSVKQESESRFLAKNIDHEIFLLSVTQIPFAVYTNQNFLPPVQGM